MNELGSRLRLARLRKELTLETIARRAGISKSYVSDLEHGRAFGTSRDVLKAIVEKGLGERWEDWEEFVEDYLFHRELNGLLRAEPYMSEASKEAAKRFIRSMREEDKKLTEERRRREREEREGKGGCRT